MLEIYNVLSKINNLKASVLKDSISPYQLGSILEEMLYLLNKSGSGGNGNGSTPGAKLLLELEDVNVNSLAEGQALVYNGDSWTNAEIDQGV